MISPVKIWRRQKEIRSLIGQRGKVFSWTKIFISSSCFKKFAPYYVVLVKLANGNQAVGQLVGNQEPKMNDKVEGIIRKVREGTKDGVIAYGIKFRLIDDHI